ncbi:hypothetical protein [Gimesia panareensis]|nr:hypothetical protein [Gimesia panareensis]
MIHQLTLFHHQPGNHHYQDTTHRHHSGHSRQNSLRHDSLLHRVQPELTRDFDRITKLFQYASPRYLFVRILVQFPIQGTRKMVAEFIDNILPQ